MNINIIAQHLNSLPENNVTGKVFDALPVEGTDNTLQVSIVGREEIPAFVTVNDDQVLCIAYLFGADELAPGKKDEMHEAMLEMNIPLSLSSFAKINDKYAIFGALSVSSGFTEIEKEISTLSDNSLEVIEYMQEFLA